MSNSDNVSTAFSQNKMALLGNIAVSAAATIGSTVATITLPSVVAGVCAVLFGVSAVSCVQDYYEARKKSSIKPE